MKNYKFKTGFIRPQAYKSGINFMLFILILKHNCLIRCYTYLFRMAKLVPIQRILICIKAILKNELLKRYKTSYLLTINLKGSLILVHCTIPDPILK